VTHQIAILHGPNLNLLGTREPEVYGQVTLAEIDRVLAERAQRRGAKIRTAQTNSEGALVDLIHEAHTWAQAIVVNPAAYTHTSVAIADALKAVGLPAFEVHLSNPSRREPYRQHSFTASACVGTIAGFGARSYYLALEAALDHLDEHAGQPEETRP
jgi:3-dehydroquinate dehydratase-2